jgi:Flp pilus assembly protein TadB
MHDRPSSGDLVTEANGLGTGLGILTFTLFPFAVPALVFVVAPLAVVAVVGLVLAIPFVLPVWLVRAVRRRQSRKAGAGMLAGGSTASTMKPSDAAVS